MLSKFPPNVQPIRVLHSGTLGDMVYTLAIMEELCKGRPVIFYVRYCVYESSCPAGNVANPRQYYHWTIKSSRCDNGRCHANNLICFNPSTRLLLDQPYVADVRKYVSDRGWWDLDPAYKIDYDLDLWRLKGQYTCDKHLILYNAEPFNIKLPDWKKPWLYISETKRPCTEPYVIVSKTDRCRDPHKEPYWHDKLKKIRNVYGDHLYFIGSRFYYDEFVRNFGHANYLKTMDVLEMAQYIKEASLVITNQTVTLALAQGLGKRYILDEHQLTKILVRLNNGYESLIHEPFTTNWDIEV